MRVVKIAAPDRVSTINWMETDRWPAIGQRTTFAARTPTWAKVLTPLLIALTALAAVAAYVSYDRGVKWEKTALVATDSLTQSRENLSEALSKVKQLQSSLDASEADVRSLESRLTALSDEKAQARDEAAQATLSAAALYDLTRSASSVTALMSQCISYQDQWSQVLYNVASGATYDRSSVEKLMSEMSSTCDNALSSAEVLRSIVDGIQ